MPAPGAEPPEARGAVVAFGGLLARAEYPPLRLPPAVSIGRGGDDPVGCRRSLARPRSSRPNRSRRR